MKNTIWVLALSWLVSVESFEPARLRSGEAFIQPPMTAGGGEVLLELEVAASGEVTGVTTLRTTPPFGDLLRQAASGWRFEPAREVQEDPDAPIAVDSKVLVAGFFRGVVEDLIMRAMDIVLALPALLLAIVIVAILGPSLTNAIMAVAIVVLPHYVRLARAAVITERTKDYVTASQVSGAGLLRLMFATVLPNCMAPLIVQATLGFSTAILDAAALGFLGLGAQPPTPEWGSMLAKAREFVQSAWWVVTFPGLAILVTVLAFNLAGDGLRDALDPKLKR